MRLPALNTAQYACPEDCTVRLLPVHRTVQLPSILYCTGALLLRCPAWPQWLASPAAPACPASPASLQAYCTFHVRRCANKTHLPLVHRMKPRVSMATPVFTTRSPMYQLMKDDLPAEWLPTIMTLRVPTI
jgi:hypothetical protein